MRKEFLKDDEAMDMNGEVAFFGRISNFEFLLIPNWLALSRERGNEAIHGYDGDLFPHSLLRASQQIGADLLQICDPYGGHSHG